MDIVSSEKIEKTGFRNKVFFGLDRRWLRPKS